VAPVTAVNLAAPEGDPFTLEPLAIFPEGRDQDDSGIDFREWLLCFITFRACGGV
jgi:hypothetical protein